MNTLERIRVELFGIRQAEMARLAGVSQSTVSRWEGGEFSPGIASFRKLRKAALDLGLPWDDTWILEQVLPRETEAAA